MKNKSFYRIMFILIILFGFNGKAFSQMHFEISPVYELKNGCLDELVFMTFDEQPLKLSELNWNIKNISYAGGKLSVSYKWFEVESKISGSFPKKSAKMYDSDWQNIPASPDMKTTFSISDNKLDYGFNFDSKAAFSINITDWFNTGLFVQYTFDQILFSARNGYGWYGSSRYSQNGEYVPFDSEYAKFFAAGSLHGIDYLRVTKSFYFGLSCGFSILNQIHIQLETGFSPFTTVDSLDHHYSPSGMESYYRDMIKSNFSLYELAADIKIRISNHLYLGSAISYNHFHETKGLTYRKQEQHGYTEMIFKDLDEYSYDTTSLSGTSGKWCTFSAYFSYIF